MNIGNSTKVIEAEKLVTSPVPRAKKKIQHLRAQIQLQIDLLTHGKRFEKEIKVRWRIDQAIGQLSRKVQDLEDGLRSMNRRQLPKIVPRKRKK